MKKIKFVLGVILLIIAAEIFMPFIIIGWGVNGKLVEMIKKFIWEEVKDGTVDN